MFTCPGTRKYEWLLHKKKKKKLTECIFPRDGQYFGQNRELGFRYDSLQVRLFKRLICSRRTSVT